MQTIEMQRMLQALGYDIGPTGADGAIGRRTTDAVAAFQRAAGLNVAYPGTVGPKTEAALASAYAARTGAKAGVSAAPLLPWLAEAKRLQGVEEIPGARSNSTIMSWARALGGWISSYYDNDDIPWCGLFVAHCIGIALPREPLPANPLSALAWSRFGVPCRPTTGAVLVFSRSGGGHVGFYVGEDAEAFHVLGGNQLNGVRISRVLKRRHEATRWPATAAAPVTGAISAAGGGALSADEA